MVFMMVCCIFMTYPWGNHPFFWARYLVDCDKFWGCKHIKCRLYRNDEEMDFELNFVDQNLSWPFIFLQISCLE